MKNGNLENNKGKNKIKSKITLKNINSKYILKRILNYLEKKKVLNAIKYNNNLKKRININLKDYKEYSENYSSIEIEIKPANNKYGKFINIVEEEKLSYHIYFNNNEEEIKRNYINENEKIKLIKIIIDNQIKSFDSLFSDCQKIESIHFKKFYRNNINNMNNMFSGCSSLKELNLNNFNTINVKDMSYMFYGCSEELIKKIRNQYNNIKIEAFF